MRAQEQVQNRLQPEPASEEAERMWMQAAPAATTATATAIATTATTTVTTAPQAASRLAAASSVFVALR